jgi:hypothetical protein
LSTNGVKSESPVPLRDLDELDVVPRQLPPRLVEHRPVGVRATNDDSSPLGQGVGDRLEVEHHAPELLASSDGEVLEVQEQSDAFFFHR